MTARELQGRLNLALAIELAPVPAWGVALAFAVTHFFVPVLQWPVLALSVVGAGWIGVRQLRKTGWTEAQAAVRLDRLAGAGGLVLALREVPDDAWAPQAAERLKSARPPRPNLFRPLMLVAGAIAFGVVVGFVEPPLEVKKAASAAAESKVEQVEAKAEALANEEALAPTLQEELARLREELDDGKFDAPDWQAADQVADALDAAARERQEALARADQAAADFQRALENNADSDAQAREREALERALQQLGEQLPGGEQDGQQQGENGQKQGENGQQGQDGQQGQTGENGEQGQQGEQGQEGQDGEQGQKPGGEGKTSSNIPEASSGQKGTKQPKPGNSGSNSPGQNPSQQQLEQLRKTLGDRQQQLERRFGQRPVPQQGQGQPGEGDGQGQGKGKGKGQGKGQPGDGEPGEGEGDGEGEPGQGGPSRGGKGAPLRFGDETTFDKDRLGFAPLPEGAGGEADQLWGLSKSSPRAPVDRALGATGDSATGDDGTTLRDGPVPPRHRDSVKRYFDPKTRPIAPAPTPTDTPPPNEPAAP